MILVLLDAALPQPLDKRSEAPAPAAPPTPPTAPPLSPALPPELDALDRASSKRRRVPGAAFGPPSGPQAPSTTQPSASEPSTKGMATSPPRPPTQRHRPDPDSPSEPIDISCWGPSQRWLQAVALFGAASRGRSSSTSSTSPGRGGGRAREGGRQGAVPVPLVTADGVLRSRKRAASLSPATVRGRRHHRDDALAPGASSSLPGSPAKQHKEQLLPLQRAEPLVMRRPPSAAFATAPRWPSPTPRRATVRVSLRPRRRERSVAVTLTSCSLPRCARLQASSSSPPRRDAPLQLSGAFAATLSRAPAAWFSALPRFADSSGRSRRTRARRYNPLAPPPAAAAGQAGTAQDAQRAAAGQEEEEEEGQEERDAVLQWEAARDFAKGRHAAEALWTAPSVREELRRTLEARRAARVARQMEWAERAAAVAAAAEAARAAARAAEEEAARQLPADDDVVEGGEEAAEDSEPAAAPEAQQQQLLGEVWRSLRHARGEEPALSPRQHAAKQRELLLRAAQRQSEQLPSYARPLPRQLAQAVGADLDSGDRTDVAAGKEEEGEERGDVGEAALRLRRSAPAVRFPPPGAARREGRLSPPQGLRVGERWSREPGPGAHARVGAADMRTALSTAPRPPAAVIGPPASSSLSGPVPAQSALGDLSLARAAAAYRARDPLRALDATKPRAPAAVIARSGQAGDAPRPGHEELEEEEEGEGRSRAMEALHLSFELVERRLPGAVILPPHTHSLQLDLEVAGLGGRRGVGGEGGGEGGAEVEVEAGQGYDRWRAWRRRRWQAEQERQEEERGRELQLDPWGLDAAMRRRSAAWAIPHGGPDHRLLLPGPADGSQAAAAAAAGWRPLAPLEPQWQALRPRVGELGVPLFRALPATGRCGAVWSCRCGGSSRAFFFF